MASAPEGKPLAAEALPRSAAVARGTPRVAPFTTPAWGLRGEMELADLMALPAGILRKAETALWLGRARPEELAAWWQALVAENPQDYALLDLVMIRWMELAPGEALDRVAGTPEEYRAWLAWGRINPRLAAREAEIRGSRFLWRVLQGAGYGDPITARELLAEYPAFDYPAVQHAIQHGLMGLGWLESLEFAYDGTTLENWAAHEPEKAFEWALEHGAKVTEGTWLNLVAALDGENPERLNQILESMPSGLVRQRLMLAQVKLLAERDPDAAISLARAADSPVLRNRLLAVLGHDLTLRDPRRSLELFREFIEGGGTKSGMEVIRPNGTSYTGSSDAGGQEWLSGLMKQEPKVVYEMIREAGVSREGADMLRQASSLWLNEDRQGFVTYLLEQPAGEARDHAFINAAEMIARQQHGYGNPVGENMAEAMDWIAVVEDVSLREHQSSLMISDWLWRDAPSAVEFFSDSGPADAEQRAIYSKLKGEAR